MPQHWSHCFECHSFWVTLSVKSMWARTRREWLTQSHPLWPVDGSQYRSITSWNDSEGGQRRCHSECLDEHPKCGYYTQTWESYLLKRREFYPACGRCYLKGPWKLYELSVWSQGELSVCLPPGWGKGQAEAERVRISRKKNILQVGQVDKKLSP